MMELIVTASHNSTNEQFVVYLIRCLKRLILGQLNRKRLNLWDSYLDSIKAGCGAETVVLDGVRAITYKKTRDGYLIQIDPNIKLYGTHYRLKSICKTINNGTLTNKPYPIFTAAINEISKNIDKYMLMFAHMPA